MICQACERGSHEDCSAQVSAANSPCDCEYCWGKSDSVDLLPDFLIDVPSE